MYKIIGANQVEYGPVSAEQLRQWIAEGRVNAQTAAQAVGETTWKPLASFPEFASSFPGQSVPPAGATPPPPTPPPPSPSAAPLQPDGGRQRALSDVSGPAIGLMITAGLGIAYAILNVCAVFFKINLGDFNGHGGHLQGERYFHMASSGAGAVVGSFIQIAFSLFILFAAIKMKKLESYGLAIAASILALIPCCSPCCCVGIPIGIWALVVLNKAEVKGYFTS